MDGLIYADVDLVHLRQERMRTTSFNDCAELHRERVARFRRVPFELDVPQASVALERDVPRFPYVPIDPATPDERCREVYEIQVQGLVRRMEATGIEKISGPGVELSFRKSSAVVVDGTDLIPAEYMRTKPAPEPEPDKKAIADAIKAGVEVPGAHLEQRRSLQIK